LTVIRGGNEISLEVTVGRRAPEQVDRAKRR
jgi:hypothetical protein